MVLRKILGIVAGLAVVLAGAGLWATGQVGADNGPHRMNQSVATDSCAGCHRAHTAQAAYLLKTAEPGLCFTCHDGTQALTNVQGGRLTAPDAYGNFALKGGGFETAWIDTADPNVGAQTIGIRTTPAAVTSSHSFDGSPQMIWGNGAISATPNAGAPGLELRCTSCHNQHGNGKYRILRPNPVGDSGLAGASDRLSAGVSIPDVTHYADGHEYTTDDYMANQPPALLSQWCSQCHARYYASSGHPGSSNPTTDGIFEYRHLIDSYGPRCTTCHVSHGTNALAIGFASTVSRPGQGTAGVGGSDAGGSRLLKMDNRGICLKCHPR